MLPAGAETLQPGSNKIERNNMLWTICVILLILWVLGLVTSTTMGGLIHILLVVAVVMILVSFMEKLPPLTRKSFASCGRALFVPLPVQASG